MISIIICSRQQDIPQKLKDNIGQTIGIEHEIIVIDNSGNDYTIFSAYNKGVSLSRYPFLLFMHDDIFYHTTGWGMKVVKHFQDERTGALGVAGTPYLPFSPGAWWSAGVGYLYLLQPDEKATTPVLQDYSNELSPAREAVALDGVWFCIRKSIFATVKFDESTYKGFHFYDVDTTLQVYNQGYKLICIKDILIEHASLGVLDERWISNLLLFREKWKSILPVSCINMSLRQQCHAEYRVLNEFTATRLSISGADRKKKRRIYRDSLKQLLRFRKGFLYYKTPVWIARFLFRYLRSLV